MLNRYSVKNFKIHQDSLDIEFPGITVLTGTNNSGKTSLIQSLRVLSKIEQKAIGVPNLPFEQVDGLGELKDVLHKEVSRSEFLEYHLHFQTDSSLKYQISLRFVSSLAHDSLDGLPSLEKAILNDLRIVVMPDKRECYAYRFWLEESQYAYGKEDGEETLKIGEVPFIGLQPLSVFNEISSLSERMEIMKCFQGLVGLNDRSIRYLSPYRMVAPQIKDSGRELLEVNGNNASEIIKRWENRLIFDNKSFGAAFSEWTSRLLGSHFEVRVENNQYKLVMLESGVELGISQIGFGNTQIIPVIVQILTAKPGDIVVIENPEVHLHPKWKADLIELFVYAARFGIRIVIETQSMEMMNRLRIMVKEEKILASRVALYFFEKNGFLCEMKRIDIEKTGELSTWPENFLDRVTIDDSFRLI